MWDIIMSSSNLIEDTFSSIKARSVPRMIVSEKCFDFRNDSICHNSLHLGEHTLNFSKWRWEASRWMLEEFLVHLAKNISFMESSDDLTRWDINVRHYKKLIKD